MMLVLILAVGRARLARPGGTGWLTERAELRDALAAPTLPATAAQDNGECLELIVLRLADGSRGSILPRHPAIAHFYPKVDGGHHFREDETGPYKPPSVRSRQHRLLAGWCIHWWMRSACVIHTQTPQASAILRCLRASPVKLGFRGSLASRRNFAPAFDSLMYLILLLWRLLCEHGHLLQT
jgi:hypothetical protein